jgi:hypothetical protein
MVSESRLPHILFFGRILILTAMKPAKFERFFMVDVARKSQIEAGARSKGKPLLYRQQFNLISIHQRDKR